jgi:predicted lipoprotein with Yx(FWY)xxD motif
MEPKALALLIGLFAAVAALAQTPQTPAQWASNGLLVAPNGMTLYTFDKDATGKSFCAADCLAAWPALTAKSAAVKAPFSVITRDDGVSQVAWQGKPLYLYVADQKPGDANGDKSGGVWHAVRQGAAQTSNAPANSGGYTRNY